MAEHFLYSTFREISSNSAVVTLFKHSRNFSGDTGTHKYQQFPFLCQFLKAHADSAAAKKLRRLSLSQGVPQGSHHSTPLSCELCLALHEQAKKQKGVPTDMVCVRHLSP